MTADYKSVITLFNTHKQEEDTPFKRCVLLLFMLFLTTSED